MSLRCLERASLHVSTVLPARTRDANRRPTPSLEQLTPREQEIAGYLKLGWTNRRIAEELVVSPGTVKNHVEHIMAKLQVSDRTQAVVRALELGIIELPQ